VVGDEDGTFLCYVLTRLGLAVEHVDDDWTAAPQLVQLFGDAYYIRQLTQAHDPDAVYEIVHTSEIGCLSFESLRVQTLPPPVPPGGALFCGGSPLPCHEAETEARPLTRRCIVPVQPPFRLSEISGQWMRSG
jgi:hypothetical protein